MAGGIIQQGHFIRIELEFDELGDAVFAQFHGDAEEDILHAVFAAEVDAAGEDPVLVLDDGFHHLGCCGAGCVPGRGTHELDQFAAAHFGAFDDGIELGRADHIRYRNAGNRGIAGQGHHGVAVAAQEQRLNILRRYLERFSQECAVTGRIQDAGHAEYPGAIQAGYLVSGVGHHVQGVGNNDDDRIPGMLQDGFGDRIDDLGVGGDQIVAAHTRFAGYAGCDHHDVRTGGFFIVIRTFDVSAVIIDGGLLPGVEGFAARQVAGDIQQNDFLNNVAMRQHIGNGSANVARTDYSYFTHDIGDLKNLVFKSRKSSLFSKALFNPRPKNCTAPAAVPFHFLTFAI